MSSSASVVAVVLNYRNVADTVRCVRSLRKSHLGDHSIVVVDNAEDGETTAQLRRLLDPEVVIIASGDNLGYAGGNNIGIRFALEQGADYVWLVNPDAVVDPTTLSGLVDAAESDTDVGIVGCRVLDGDSSPERIASIGGWIDAARWGATPLRHSGRFDAEIREDGVRDVGFVSGVSILLRRTLIEDIGSLPEEYFLYFEETDYCLRAQRAGWRTVVQSGVRVRHHQRSRDVIPAAYYVYYFCRNRIHFGARYFAAQPDQVIADLEPVVSGWRRRVTEYAPDRLDTFERLVDQALSDARAGRMGRAREVESLSLSGGTKRSPAFDAERCGRDVQRLLRRIGKDASKVAELKDSLDRERLARKVAERELDQARAQTRALRASRSFRIGRAITRVVGVARFRR